MNRGAVQREGERKGVMRGMTKGQTNKQVGGRERARERELGTWCMLEDNRKEENSTGEGRKENVGK